MNVVLIGFSGSGKSSVGRSLARRLGWDFVDTDAEVERTAGRRIHEIFAEDGEAAFRRLEAKEVDRALRRGRQVVAVGGGAVVNPYSRRAIKDGNLVVLLEAEVDTILERLSRDASEEPRPMLGSNDPKARLLALKAVRDPIYRATADLVLSTDQLGVDDVARELAGRVAMLLSESTTATRGEP